ncbi:annexin 3 [Pelomyxa schiedti]|nr:annexin 3 [Pelomyxa schiedti]
MAAQTVVIPETAVEDAQKFHTWLHGNPGSECAQANLFASRPRAHMQLVAMSYNQQFGHTLESELRGCPAFNGCMAALCKAHGEFLADTIHEAVHGRGANEAFIDVLTQISSEELAELKEAWTRKYNSTLEGVVAGETTGDFQKTLLELLKGTRMPPGTVDESKIEAQAQRLFAAGEGRLGTDEDAFIDILTHSSAAHVQAVSKFYYKTYNHHSIQTAVKKETSGDFQRCLLALCVPRDFYTAERIHHAIQSSTPPKEADDALFIRLFCMNDHKTLGQAVVLYMGVNAERVENALTRVYPMGSVSVLLMKLVTRT